MYSFYKSITEFKHSTEVAIYTSRSVKILGRGVLGRNSINCIGQMKQNIPREAVLRSWPD